MEPSNTSERINKAIGGPELWELRRETAIHVIGLIKEAGAYLAAQDEIPSDRGEALRTMGTIVQMCGELGIASSRMLSGREHYAGAALLRQIVEIEYLTWTFEKGKSDIKTWLASTDKERMRTFTPAQLRKNSKGRFLSADYKNHCEQGGHPVPRGIPLLGGKSIPGAQILLVDLLLHCWRTWDQVRAWLKTQDFDVPAIAKEVGPRLTYWGENDPVYKIMCEVQPEDDARRPYTDPA